MNVTERCVESYRKHKRLFTVGEELGIKWQTVYYHLRKAGEPVTGDKTRYGSKRDIFAAKSEDLFKELVPFASSYNGRKFQAPYDFDVGGVKVEIKASSKRVDGWCFSLKKQSKIADLFVCFGYGPDRETVEACFVFPIELVRSMQTLRVSTDAIGNPSGKWGEFQVAKSELAEFFGDIISLDQAS